MPDHPHRARRRRLARGSLSVAIVLALSALMFTANAGLHRGDDPRQPQDIAELSRHEEARVEQLSTQVDALRSDVNSLSAAKTKADGTVIGTAPAGYVVESGRTEVTGRGVVVTLDDAPTDVPLPAQAQPDDLVVHQQDLQEVVNALWAGGAEALELMDQRVISTSAFQCVGNVLRLHGRVYSPPYTVTAIGDPDELSAALLASPGIQIYLQYVDAYGLGWNVQRPSKTIDIPAYSGQTDLQYAKVPAGTQLLPGLGTSTASTPSTSGSSQSPSAGTGP